MPSPMELLAHSGRRGGGCPDFAAMPRDELAWRMAVLSAADPQRSIETGSFREALAVLGDGADGTARLLHFSLSQALIRLLVMQAPRNAAWLTLCRLTVNENTPFLLAAAVARKAMGTRAGDIARDPLLVWKSISSGVSALVGGMPDAEGLCSIIDGFVRRDGMPEDCRGHERELAALSGRLALASSALEPADGAACIERLLGGHSAWRGVDMLLYALKAQEDFAALADHFIQPAGDVFDARAYAARFRPGAVVAALPPRVAFRLFEHICQMGASMLGAATRDSQLSAIIAHGKPVARLITGLTQAAGAVLDDSTLPFIKEIPRGCDEIARGLPRTYPGDAGEPEVTAIAEACAAARLVAETRLQAARLSRSEGGAAQTCDVKRGRRRG